MNKMNDFLSLSLITKKYGTRTILDQIDLAVSRGDYISVTGKSGAGKSTLINILALLDRDFQGSYCFEGTPIHKKDHTSFRNRHIGLLFQQYNLLPTLTARENVLLPYTYYNGVIDDIGSRCERLFEEFGLSYLIHQRVNTLSGGEKQRVALLRCMIHDPDIILADEPTGNLDNNNAKLIQDFLAKNHQAGKTIIVVTHDLSLANHASRKLFIENGKLYEHK